MASLSEAQEDTLRYLCRQSGPVPRDHVDGRVLRVLLARGYVSAARGWVSATSAGRDCLAALAARAGGESAKHGRRDAILRAIEAVERATPLDAEVRLGETTAYADDVLLGLRRYARRLPSPGAPTSETGSSAPPRRRRSPPPG